jgi:hypothetical protein
MVTHLHSLADVIGERHDLCQAQTAIAQLAIKVAALAAARFKFSGRVDGDKSAGLTAIGAAGLPALN